MADDPEPAENIGGDAGRVIDAETETVPRSRAETVVNRLGDHYWRKQYGGRDAFDCLVRTILSQNTSDAASQPAFDELLARFDGDDLATSLAHATEPEIAETIRAAGLYNRKATVLRSAAERVLAEFGGSEAFDAFVAESDRAEARDVLLSFDGVGPKTADCVLLFAGGRAGVFPVDTHVHRIARRLGIAPPDADHETVRAALEGGEEGNAGVPAEQCGFGHTAMIQFGREYCTAREPACLSGPGACPLFDLCDRVGVDLGAGEVVDPGESPGS